jgi:glyoxalase family protein
MNDSSTPKLITGIHHVTAISGDVQQNIDFYTGILGLKLVKQTVNYDYPEVYHFYFGNNGGEPGTIMTTFPYGSEMTNGRHGKGKVNTTAFSVPLSAVDYWLRRLEHFKVLFKHPQERFGGSEVVIYLEDSDGMGVELIFNDADTRPPISPAAVPEEHAIRGIHHVELWLEGFERTAAVLTERMNHTLLKEGAGRFRFGVDDTPGRFVDLLCMPNSLGGLDGSGMVHHVAFSTPDASTLLELRESLQTFGLDPTGVRDRNYFRSIYFKEPGGVLFEIATAEPGFGIDENPGELGQSLQLPPRFEEKRQSLDKTLPSFTCNPLKFRLE